MEKVNTLKLKPKKVSTPGTYSIEAKKSGSVGTKAEGNGPQRQLQNKIHKGRHGNGRAACTGGAACLRLRRQLESRG
jgi:hypothetical protein